LAKKKGNKKGLRRRIPWIVSFHIVTSFRKNKMLLALINSAGVLPKVATAAPYIRHACELDAVPEDYYLQRLELEASR